MNCVISLPGSAGMWHDLFSVGYSRSTYLYLKTTQKNSVTSSSFGHTLREIMKDDAVMRSSIIMKYWWYKEPWEKKELHWCWKWVVTKNLSWSMTGEFDCDVWVSQSGSHRHRGWDMLVSFTVSDLHLYFIPIPAALQRKQMQACSISLFWIYEVFSALLKSRCIHRPLTSFI